MRIFKLISILLCLTFAQYNDSILAQNTNSNSQVSKKINKFSDLTKTNNNLIFDKNFIVYPANKLKDAGLTIEILNIDFSLLPDSIRLFCSVTDKNGLSIANLAPPYNIKNKNYWKKLVERINNENYQIKDFRVIEIHEKESPGFITSFVLDYSGSMGGEIPKVEYAVKRVKKFIRIHKDKFDLVQFDQRIFNPIKKTADTSKLNNLIPYDSLGGATAFYNASYEGLSNISKSKKQKVAILFTDGQDNQSLLNAFDIITKARKINAKVFVIGYGGASQAILTQIATQTGGKAYFPNNLDELDDIFFDIYQNLNVYYVITYKLIKRKANLHNITVYFNIPTQNKLIFNSRLYYIKPIPFEEDRKFSFALFDEGSSTVSYRFYPAIINLSRYLKNNPNLKISIYGHTDSYGNEATQKDISLRRAYAVEEILINNGIDIDQIVNIDGLGFEKPIYPNDKNSEWKRYENRRVEVIFEK